MGTKLLMNALKAERNRWKEPLSKQYKAHSDVLILAR
jgi:hypothetical protein